MIAEGGKIHCEIGERDPSTLCSIGIKQKDFRRTMRSVKVFLSAGVACAVASLILAGCETTRVNKLHSPADSTSDITTVPHPDPQYASVATGIPPVPGSPTAAGPDGLQPTNDDQARKSPGAEKGRATAPREQPKDPFIRQ